MLDLLKKVDSAIDEAFAYTQLPQLAGAATGAVGRGFDALVGTNIAPTVEKVGEQIPRTIVEGLLTIPEGLSGVGAPVAAATWLNRARKIAQVAGYGSAFTKGAAETDSLAGGLVSAGSMGLANKLFLPAGRGGLDIGGKAAGAVEGWLNRETPDLVTAGRSLPNIASQIEGTTAAQRYLPTVARLGTDLAAGTALNELTRQASMSVGPNAVGLTDPARNPLTPENIAANVVGSVPFAPQAITAYRERPRLNTKQTNQAAKEIYARSQVESPELPTTSRHELVLRQMLSNHRQFRSEGRLADAENTFRGIREFVEGLSTGQVSPDVIRSAVSRLDETTRLLPPENMSEFERFVTEYNDLVEVLNRGKDIVDERLSQEMPARPEDMVVRDERSLKARQEAVKAWKERDMMVAGLEKDKGKTWHPNAVPPEVLSRLQERGLLPKLTPEAIEQEFQYFFDRSAGDSSFARQAVLQKWTNKLLDAVPDALKREEAEWKAPADVQPTELTPEAQRRYQKLDKETEQFVEGMNKFEETLPVEDYQKLIQRTVDILQRPDQFKFGRPVNIQASWRKAVALAGTSYDPVTKSVMVWGGKGQPKRIPLEHFLGSKREDGSFHWTPAETAVRIAEGGKPKGEAGGNLEDVSKSGQQKGDLMGEDDAEFQRILMENQGAVPGSLASGEKNVVLREGELPTKIGVPSGVENAPDIIDEPRDFTIKSNELAGKVSLVKSAMKSLDDKQLYQAVQEYFQPQRANAGIGGGGKDPLRIYRSSGGLRKAIEAAMENYGSFSDPTKTDVGPAGKVFLGAEIERGRNLRYKNDKENLRVALSDFFGGKEWLGKVGKVVERLSDSKTVELLKKGPGSKAAPGDISGPTTQDVFVNTQKDGSFVQDVGQTLSHAISRTLGEQGYSGSYRDMMTTLSVAIARQMGDVPVDFYRVSGPDKGYATVREGRGKVGLNVDSGPVTPENAQKYVNGLLEVLQHELTHIDQFIMQGLIDAPDAYSQQRKQLVRAQHTLAQSLTPDEREAFLTTLEESLHAPAGRQNIREQSADPATGTRRKYGTNDPDEFVAEINRLILLPLVFGKDSPSVKTAFEVLDYSPAEVRAYAQNTYRTIHDVMAAMKKTISDPAIRQSLGKDALPPLVDKVFASAAFQTVVDTAHLGSKLRDADLMLAEARNMVSTLAPGAASFPPVPTPAVWFRTGDKVRDTFLSNGPDVKAMPAAADAVDTASKFLSARGDETTKPSLWARWFYPFQQLMFSMERAGVPLARPLANLALDLEAGVTRTRSQILSPFLIRDASGKVKFDQDNALVQLVNEGKKGPWRDAVNRLSAWQQENGAQSMFVKGPDGLVTVNESVKGAKEEWTKVQESLSPADAQKVSAAMVAMDQTSQIAAQRLVATIDVSNRHRVAKLLMVMNRKMTYEQALAMSDQVVGGYLSGDVSSVSRTGLPPEQLVQLEGLLAGPDGLLTKFGEVQEKLLNRPGFRTESLPGDYVLRFTTPEGTVRYLSADSQHKAHWLARKLVKEGNTIAGEIVKKEQLRDYTDFDSPDTILAKFAEVEGAVWDRFLTNIQEKHGNLFNEQLLAELKAYAPGAETLRELGTKGMGAFLTERKSQIDRSRYDYIDGMFSWVGRLSTSMEYKNVRQMKDLILSDPRAQGFPSLKAEVEPFFQNLMSPTGQGTKELKTFATAYMMGGSLASAVINGTQSAVTLVPTLIQLGSKEGPVGAYRLLAKGVAAATETILGSRWQKLAQEAERVDPALWSLEQSKAALYKRSVTDGGIDHGIIQDDIFTPTDVRTVMTAKFGHGNYGPTTAGEMARSGVYSAAQMSLKPFGWIESFNNKISLFAGVEQGYLKGLRGEALYDHAKLVKTLSTFGGGKANVPGLVPKLSTAYTRSAVGVANTLQQYGYGVVASYAQLVKDSLGQSKGLSAQERRQAQKAFGTMFATQVALGGALGLPFAAASLTLLEKVFGVPANQLVREGLASLGEDDEQGAVIAETALNGIGNQMFGLDVSSRVGVSNLLGTSAYRGFNLADMAGPVGSIVGNAADALNWFGQNEPMKAAKALVPVSMKTLVEMSDSRAKYGDVGMRDSGGNLLYQPTNPQAFAYGLGFRPRELSQKRQAQALLQSASERASQSRSRDLDAAANALLSGDPTAGIRYAQNARIADPTIDAQAVMRSIVDRAVDSRMEKDLLAQGSSANEAERQRIAGTFGPGVVSRQSEMTREQLGLQLGAQLGLAPNPKRFQKAAMVDMLVQQRGLPRSQALRLVEFLQ